MEEYSEISHYTGHLSLYKVLHYFGVYPTKNCSKVWIIYSIFVHIYAFLIPFAIIIYDFSIIKNVYDLFESGTIMITFLSCAFNVFSLHVYPTKIVETLRDLKKLKTDEEVDNFISVAEKRVARFGQGFVLVLCSIGMAINVLGHYIVDSDKLIYTLGLAFEQSWMKNVAFWVQFSQLIFIMPNFVSAETVLMSYFVILEAHLRCVVVKMRNLAEDSSNIGIKRKFKKIIEYHVKVKR